MPRRGFSLLLVISVLQTSGMWSKIYLGTVAIATAIMAFFTYYSYSWIESIGDPLAAASGYEYHSSISWVFLLVSTCVLLLLASAYFWTSSRLWALWTTFAYFAVFIGLRYFWLEPSFFAFEKARGLSQASFSAKPLLAVILILVMAAIVFADQLILIRLRAKAYPEPIPVNENDDKQEDAPLSEEL